MERIQVGEYVKTPRGISKAKSIDDENYRLIVWLENGNCFEQYLSCNGEWHSDYGEKHSFDFMELVDIGDYANGHKILGFLYNEELYARGIVKKEHIVTTNGVIKVGELKTIVTARQFAEAECEVKAIWKK